MNKLFSLNFIVVFMASLLLNSCGTAEYRKAKFNRATDLVINDLMQLNDFESANIKWSVSQFDDSVSHNLKVILKNGKNLPKNDSVLNLIGKDAMRIVINSIDNKEDYDKFIVYFITEIKSGPMRYSEENPFAYHLQDFK